MVKTKFNKDVAWLEPFMHRVKDLVPLRRLAKVRGFSVPLDKVEQLDGQCTEYRDGSCVITIRNYQQSHRSNQNGTFTAYRHRHRMIYDIMLAFAHELAHLKHWDHTPEHWELECRIIRRFISELKRRGVRDITTRKVKDAEKKQG